MTTYLLNYLPACCTAWPAALPACHLCPPPGYLLIPITGVVLGGSNLAGYFKCSKDAKKQLQSMTANMATSAMTSAMTGRLQAAIARV